MDKLYAWAAEEGVAVMAHASNSNGAADEYSERANPKGWSQVLARYPELRLNLAHFGGFGERRSDDSLEGTWEDGVGQLIAAGHGDVYADVSYFSETLSGPADAPEQRSMAALTTEFVREYDPDLRHLMYGSDWIMLGLEENHEAYLARVLDLFRQVADGEAQLRRFLAGNAGALPRPSPWRRDPAAARRVLPQAPARLELAGAVRQHGGGLILRRFAALVHGA